MIINMGFISNDLVLIRKTYNLKSIVYHDIRLYAKKQLNMKLPFLLFFIFCFSINLTAQKVLIADDGTYNSLSNNALLDVAATNNDKGILIPRITSAQRNAININQINDVGLLVYDNTTNSFWYWNGTAWKEIGANQNISGIALVDADGDTRIEVEKNPDEDIIRFEVDTFPIATLDTNGLNLNGSLSLMYGTIVNDISDNAAISHSDTTLVTANAIRKFTDNRTYISVKEYGVMGDGVTDDSDSLMVAIRSNPNGTLFVPDGVYVANFSIDTAITLISYSGNVIFKSDVAGSAVLTVNAKANLHNLTFHHTDSTTDGSDGLWNNNYDIKAYNCTFVGHELNATGNSSSSNFHNCTFTTHDAGLTNPPSFGTIAWSGNSTFNDCLFNGTFGADAQDSKFYGCTFDAKWGIHMPEGRIDNSGNLNGFEGDAEFHNCVIKGSDFYGIGIGNDAHPKLYHCTVIGHTSAIYARTQSTYEAYNCYFESTLLTAGGSALVMSKWLTATHISQGLQASGDSYFSNCTFAGGQYHLNIPDSDTTGQMYMSNCAFDPNKIYVDTKTSGNGDKDKYLTEVSNFDVPYQNMTLSSGEILTPKYSANHITYLDVAGNGSPVNNIKINKLFGNNKEYPLGYRLMIRCGHLTNTITLKNGYNAAIGTGLFTSSGKDLTIHQGEIVVMEYINNAWWQTSNLGALKAVDGVAIDEFSTDGTLADNSDLAVPTEKAVKTYVDNWQKIESKLNVTTNSNLSFMLPAGYKITSIVVEEKNGNPAGNIQLGITTNGNEIATATAVSANDLVDIPITKGLFSLSNDNSIFISSDSWGSGKVDVYIKMEKVK